MLLQGLRTSPLTLPTKQVVGQSGTLLHSLALLLPDMFPDNLQAFPPPFALPERCKWSRARQRICSKGLTEVVHFDVKLESLDAIGLAVTWSWIAFLSSCPGLFWPSFSSFTHHAASTGEHAGCLTECKCCS